MTVLHFNNAVADILYWNKVFRVSHLLFMTWHHLAIIFVELLFGFCRAFSFLARLLDPNA